jgi:hypothetical protein
MFLYTPIDKSEVKMKMSHTSTKENTLESMENIENIHLYKFSFIFLVVIKYFGCIDHRYDDIAR